ncbi:MAG TPA: hypothetical protein VGR00_14090, partial [Thermoanaerobaculia bacterium]|nr:hypothetical protein [Thermoanaerobaculia bacterium]
MDFTIVIAGLFILVDGATAGQTGTAHAVLVHGGGNVPEHSPLLLVPASAVVPPLPPGCLTIGQDVVCDVVGSVISVETGDAMPNPVVYGSPSPNDRLISLKGASGGTGFK